MKGLRVAVIHEWLVSQRGGENVLDAICELFPNADLYALVHEVGSVSSRLESMKPRTSFLQSLPQATSRYRHFLPLMPLAVSSFDMSAYDLILSSSHCVAKGVRKRPGAVHVSYVHAPMRYMWDRFDEYFSAERSGSLTRWGARVFRPYLQWWDRGSAKGIDRFLANSHFIAGQIRKIYNRDSTVVYPFCEFNRFSGKRNPQNWYLMVSALVPYKRVDLAIEVFKRTGRILKIVGDGPDRRRLEGLAEGTGVEFLGALPSEEIAKLYLQAKGLIFPGVEDFGIVPVEAMASGLPVVAFGEGGALETVVAEKTGVFFHKPSIQALQDSLEYFESRHFDEMVCRERAGLFTRERFQKDYLAQVEKALRTEFKRPERREPFG